MEKEPSLSEKWESLTLAHNFIFCKVMESNPDICKRILEILLRFPIDHIDLPEKERDFKADYDSKGIRFDVYAKDSNRCFDIEIQTTNRRNLKKRARYYQGLMDVGNLKPGEDYETLKESYVIFLCFGDLFKKKEPIYTFENICRKKNDLKLDDGAYKVFFNVKNYANMPTDEQKEFFTYLCKNVTTSDFTGNLAETVRRAKHNAQWRHQYMTWEQSIREEAEIRAEAMAEERAEKKAKEMATEIAKKEQIQTAQRLLQMKLTPEQVAEATRLSIKEVESLL